MVQDGIVPLPEQGMGAHSWRRHVPRIRARLHQEDPMDRSPRSLALVVASLLAPSAALAAQPGADNDAIAAMQRQLDQLAKENRDQAEQIKALRELNGEQWLTEQRAEQVRGVVRDVLADSSTRSSFRADGATSGYDKNFFIASPDGNFRLNLEGQIQVRYSYSNIPNSSLSGSVLRPPAPAIAPRGDDQLINEYGWEIRRMQLNFFGHVFDPTIGYRVQFQYQRDYANSGPPLRFADVYIQKAFGDGWFGRVGQWKNFFNYEENTSSRTQQFAERSLVNEYFNTKFVQGALLGWEGNDLRVYASYNDGGANRDVGILQSNGNLTEWAFTGRAEWRLAGDWGQFKDMQGWRGSPFAAMLGMAVNWQRGGGNPPAGRQVPGNGTIIPGQTQADRTTGVETTSRAVADEMTLLTWTTDMNLRGDGWSAWSAFLGNYTYAGGQVAKSNGVDGTLSFGAVVQGGVFVTDALELIARYEGIWVISDFDPASYQANPFNAQTLNILTVGANWYLQKNRLKVTLDAGYAFNPLLFSSGLYGENTSGANWRPSQTGEGTGEVVVRAQMQLLF
jgi:hypothetical protein